MAKAKKIGYAVYRYSTLKKITDRAKQLRKAKPSLKWTDAIKQASAAINSGKPAPAKKAAAKKAPAKKAAKAKKPVRSSGSAKASSKLRTGRKISGKTMKPATVQSIDHLRKYGELIKDKERAENALVYIRSLKFTNPREKQIKTRSIANTLKTIKAIKRQLAIQKTLI